MSKNIIEVENLSKRFRIGIREKRAETFYGQILQSIKAPLTNFRRLAALSKFSNDDESVFWALRDINFNVKEGELLGIIGRNGAGKSTLLKVLSRITEPTSGQVTIRGRVASLLEVGTGFHPELTGRENIYMNGTVLGMTKKEIDRKMEEIVEFSGVSKFIETPVKFYSSGMKVRLGFSVAAHLEPEILIVDEVLAVGDMEFQRKCMGKMEEVSQKQGRTVIFVSHNMAAIRALCNQAILLKNGCLSIKDSTEVVASKYLKGENEIEGMFDVAGAGSTTDKVKFQKIIFRNQNGLATQDFAIGDDLTIEIYYEALEKFSSPYFFIGVKSKYGPLCGANSLMDGKTPNFIEGQGVIRCTFKRLPLLPQQYDISIGVRASDGRSVLATTQDIGFFNILTKVSDIGFNGALADVLAPDSAPVLLPYSWQFHNEQIIDVNFLNNVKS
jgi:lipopolysaccharide transport system ATP-binding protein